MTAQRASKDTPGDGRQRSRAKRRQQSRAASRRQPAKTGLSPAEIIGGIVTAAIIAGIVIYTIIRTTGITGSPAASTHGKPATIAGDYNPAASTLKAGSKAPDFTLTGMNGKSYALSAQRGHTVVLEFFAVWCPHCQHEAPIMQRIADQYTPKGVRMWMILASPYGPNYDNSFGTDTTPATKQDVRNFGTLYGEHLPKLINPTYNIVNKYGAGAYPTIYVINKKGAITYAEQGDQTYGALTEAIRSAS